MTAGSRRDPRAGTRRLKAGAGLIALVLSACGSTPQPSVTLVPPLPSVAPTIEPTADPSAIASPSAAAASPSLEPEPSASFPVLPADVARLDGAQTDPALASRLPLAIMIDDNVAARPQAGFNAASIVYQAPADGGEDRYMLVFQEKDASLVGPVRSGRPYFVRWASEFRAAFGHYGGDAKTLQQVIPQLDGTLMFDVDALRNASGAYHRVSGRQPPHNAYTSTATFRKEAIRVGAPGSMVGGLANWTFTDGQSLANRPARGTITIPYGRGTVGYVYDRRSNAYLRSVSGVAQMDAGDGKRVVARNVVVLFMRLSYDPESEPGHRRPVLDQIGSGQAIVFRDGQAIKGTWRKDDVGGLTRFFDATGTEISLVRGNVFIQVVATGTKVAFTVR